MKKIILVICDGLGDRPSANLNGKTPLQAARKPNIDRLASASMLGLIYTISPGVTPGSDTSHLSLLGYDPKRYYTGRGPLEAIGAGLKLREGDIAFRCNFATVDHDGIVIDRRAGRIKEPDTGKLASIISEMRIDGHTVFFKESTEHRCVLVVRGEGLGANVTDTDPGVEGKGILKASGRDAASQRTAEIVNTFTDMAMKKLAEADLNRERERKGLKPANAILARGAGEYPKIEPFFEKRGMRMGGIVAEGLIVGICRVLGAEVSVPAGFTAGMDMDVSGVAKEAERMLSSVDFLLIHIKPTDVAGHDGNAKGKMEVLERIDDMIGRIAEIEGTVLALTGDHSTPVSAREHTCDPVPLLIHSRGLRSDGISSFDEISCSRGSLSGLRGLDITPLLMGYADRNEKYGA
jgi:2,3-bisphosphoglycerate-independent phosphoglycerate mutase